MTPIAPLQQTLITIFMCGDVMLGRGIDQVMPHPSDPIIYESYVKDARRYVQIAEDANGPISRPVPLDYIWGHAFDILNADTIDLRLINLETSVTTSDNYWRGKGINYRMHPKNIPALKEVQIDVVSLANNHVLDWGFAGLEESIKSLNENEIATVGAGDNLEQAQSPAIFEMQGKGRVLVFASGSTDSGVPLRWAATESEPGVNLIEDFSRATVQRIRAQIQAIKRPNDIVILSLHWGGNWGFSIPSEHQEFAHALVDEAFVDVVHGHSSHHIKAIEIYQGKLIVYGSGDLITDYEGIGGHESYRGDLGLLYFAAINPSTGMLAQLRMLPSQMKNFRLTAPSPKDVSWILDTLNREGKKLGTHVESDGKYLQLVWE
ncbi:MAG: CapA family protein [Gammaproteobacteria bacterium]|nr:CapA family protein [Gammaproteobacteria bacterium]